MPLASLHRGLAGQHLVHRFPKPLGSIDHAQHTLIDAQATVEKAPQKRTAHPLVLRGRLHEARYYLFPFNRNAKGDHHLVVPEGLAIEEDGHDFASP